MRTFSGPLLALFVLLVGCPPGSDQADMAAGDGGFSEDARPVVMDQSQGGAGDMAGPAVLGFCNDQRWCWEHPLPQGNRLAALWVFSSNDIWAAGQSGTTLHFDGMGWTAITTGTDRPLVALWGSDPRHLWAAGSDGTLLFWNGMRWASVPSGTPSHLRALWGTGADNVWAAGTDGVLLRWEGTIWTPVPSGTREEIWGLWGGKVDDLWATTAAATGAEKPILHWDGSRWSQATGLPAGVTRARALWGVSPQDVIVSANKPIRWDGTQWREMPVEMGILGPFQALWASGPNQWWGVTGGTIVRSAGGTWSIQPGPVLDPSGREQLWALKGAGPNEVWSSSYRLHHWDGTSWATTGEGSQERSFSSGWAAGPQEAWAVGAGPGTGLIYRRRPKGWEQAFQSAEGLAGIWGSGPDDVWAVGRRGRILHWDGRSWQPSPSGTVTDLNSVLGVRADAVFAVGEQGVIVRWDGSSWMPVMSNTTEPLYKLWSSGPNDVWACGAEGSVLRWNGMTWRSVRSAAGETLMDISGTGADDVWVVGNGPGPMSLAFILHWDGRSFAKTEPMLGHQLTSVHAMAANDVWAGSNQGVFLRWDGMRWQRVPSGSSANLRDIFAASTSLWTVGGSGTILRHQP